MNSKMRILMKMSLQAVIVMVTTMIAYGQKLNNEQEGNMRAPAAGIKVDGKLTEWPAFKTYNKTTQLNYMLANDDKNLYFVVKSTDATNTTKILGGGISLAINTEDKKKDKDAFVLTFPVVDRAALRGAGGFGGRRGGGNGGGGGFGGGRGGRGGGGGNAGGPPTVDSTAMIQARKDALATVKEMKAIGFKDIPDSVLSIYNAVGIKVAATIDDKGNFLYELSVPLSLLNLTVGTSKEFAYDVKVNGIQMGNRQPGQNGQGGPGGQGGGFGGGGGGFGGGRGGRGGGGGGGRGGFGGGGGPSGLETMLSPTDFWGKYTLAK